MEPDRIGPYLVSSRLGSGGMGTVYKAWDERLRRWVAIKSVDPDEERGSERRSRLQREARALAGLNHPALAQVHDLVEEGGHLHIVMEYVDGRSLAALLVDGPLEVARAVDLARQIAQGLGVAHGRGVLHRDLKAENVMVTSDDQVKILDFGLAKRLDPDSGEESLTAEGVVMGTTRAMSPEQAEGRSLDHRSDLFALGSLLYEMTTGRHPFQASTPLETMQQVVGHHPPPLRRLNPALPKSLERLVERLHEKDPALRPANAAEVVAALDEIAAELASGQSMPDRLAAPPVKARAPLRPARVALLLALLAALAALLVLLVG